MITDSPYLPGMAGRPAQRPRTPFGERLAAARDAGGLTQAQLADKLGTTQSNVASWERETVALRPEQLIAIADALNVTADFLLGRDQAKRPSSKGPPGKLRIAFEQAHRLPRHDQKQIIKMVQAYVHTYQKAS